WDVIDSSRRVWAYSVTAEPMRPGINATWVTPTPWLPASLRSVPALSVPVRLIPTASARKKTTIPTSTRNQLAVMRPHLRADPRHAESRRLSAHPPWLECHVRPVRCQPSDPLHEPAEELVGTGLDAAR